MVWVDKARRGTGGTPQGGEIIFSLDHNEHTGTVHILATLRWLQGHGVRARTRKQSGRWTSDGRLSTRGQPERFTVSAYTLRSGCRTQVCG